MQDKTIISLSLSLSLSLLKNSDYPFGIFKVLYKPSTLQNISCLMSFYIFNMFDRNSGIKLRLYDGFIFKIK